MSLMLHCLGITFFFFFFSGLGLTNFFFFLHFFSVVFHCFLPFQCDLIIVVTSLEGENAEYFAKSMQLISDLIRGWPLAGKVLMRGWLYSLLYIIMSLSHCKVQNGFFNVLHVHTRLTHDDITWKTDCTAFYVHTCYKIDCKICQIQ